MAENQTPSPSKGTWGRTSLGIATAGARRLQAPRLTSQGRCSTGGGPTAPALLPRHRCVSGWRSPVPVRGIPRLRLRGRTRGWGITSGAHSAAGRAGARKARAPAVTPELSGVPHPSAAGPQVPPQPPQHSALNWWAARPAAATSTQRPFGAALPPLAPD